MYGIGVTYPLLYNIKLSVSSGRQAKSSAFHPAIKIAGTIGRRILRMTGRRERRDSKPQATVKAGE